MGSYAVRLTMPGKEVKNWRVYEALRRDGKSKESAARIANASHRLSAGKGKSKVAKQWIQKATDKMKKKGTLGKFGKATKSKIAAGKKKGGKAEKRAVFAENMKKIANKRKRSGRKKMSNTEKSVYESLKRG